MMVTQITKGIKISVETEYESSFYKQRKLHYSYKYSVKIENQSKEIVKLNGDIRKFTTKSTIKSLKDKYE